MAEKRVIEQTASSEIYNDDWFLKDSVLEGTSKISGANLKELLGADGTQALEEIANAIAEEYDSTQTYTYNSWVFHEGVLYRCITQSVTGTWDATKWQAKTIKEFIADSENLITSRLRAMFGEYLPISTLDPPYVAPISKGDLFIYQQTNRYKFYRAKADHPQGVTEFDIDDWDEFDTVADLIEDVTEKIDEIEIPVKDVQVKTDSTYDSVVDASGNAKIDLSNKADKDGMYDELFAGNLVTDMHTADNAPYLYRQSPSASSVSQNIVGGTVAWNQFYKINSFNHTLRGLSSSITNSVITITGTTESAGYCCQLGRIDFANDIKGHKVARFIDFSLPNGVRVADQYNNNAQPQSNTIVEIASSLTIPQIFTDSGNVNVSVSNGHISFIDLTQMFGSTIADYIYSLEQATAGAGIAYFRNLFPKSYYDYNSGALMSVKTSGRKIVGKNIASVNSVTAGSGNVDIYNGIGIQSNITISFKCNNFSFTNAGASLVVIIDSDNQAHPITPSGFGLSANIVYNNRVSATYNLNYKFIRLFIPTTGYTNISGSLDDIQIELGSTATDYEPYNPTTYPLDSDLTLRGIVKKDANNNLYYDGDIYASDGSVTRRYGVVDLGTLTFGEYGSTDDCTQYYTTALDTLAKASAQVFSAKFIYDAQLNPWTVRITSGTTGKTYFRTPKDLYGSPSAFKTAMSGVYLVYELATPTSETADAYENPQLVGSTEEFIDTRNVPIPVGGERKYYTDLKAKLEELAKIPDVPSTNGTYTLKATRSASGVAYNWISG